MTDSTMLTGSGSPPAAPPAPPSRPTRQEALEAWRTKRSQILSTRDAAALERQLSRGKLLARERIEQLLDPGSFHELHMLRYTAAVPELDGKRTHGDGIVAGYGTIEGRRIFVFAQDPTVVGGSLGEIGGSKVHRVIDLAIEAGAPLVGISDGGGARIQEGVSSLVAFGGIFLRNTRASGVVPQISVIMGVSTGGAVYSPALTDFVFMVEGTASMAITGPKVVKEVTGEDVSLEELGGVAVHAERSGVVHFAVPDEQSCLDAIRRLLGFLPPNNRQLPPVTSPSPPRTARGWDPFDALPPEPDTPYDVRRIITALVDSGDLFEYSARQAPNALCGFARLDGHPVGIVANQPDRLEGRLDVDGCEKVARFVRTCDAFNVPVLTLVDCPGFAPTEPSLQGALVRAAAKLAWAYTEATCPTVHLITGRAWDEAIVAMGATRTLSGMCVAWPTADIAATQRGPVRATDSRDDLRSDRSEPREPAHADESHRGPYDAAMAGTIDQIIEPDQTRDTLIEALSVLRTVERPPVPRKHENLPL